VKVCLRPNEVLFRTGRAVIYSRLVEGRFPDYRAVIPKKSSVKVALQAATFQAAGRQAAVQADVGGRGGAVSFRADRATLQSRGAPSGRSKIEMPLEYPAKPIEINFNAEYLIDVLKVLPLETDLTLDLIDGANPALFRHGENYSYLVMPLT